MGKQLTIRIALVSLFLVSCSIPGYENTPGVETPTVEVVAELPTSTIQPENTVEASATETTVPVVTPDITLEPSPTPFPEPWYILQPGTPLATFNTPHAAAGCSWLGVGGQVFGPDSVPVPSINILVSGTLDGYPVDGLGTTGMETNIGEGGYEVTLADHPVDSTGTLWIQIIDTNGIGLSDRIPFNTFNNCDQNFVLINFIRLAPLLPSGSGWSAFLPLITNRTGLQPTPIP